MKNFKIKGENIKEILQWQGPSGAIATDKIMVEGCKVGYMYREEPVNNYPDSGWRFFQGEETDEYVNNIKNSGIYDLNTICNYDPDIIPFLTSDYGTSYYRDSEGNFICEGQDTKEIEKIDKYIKETLSEKRYQHSIRVMHKALEYADIYNQDSEKAKIVALAHDIAKEFTKEENEQYVKENNLDKNLLHPENKYIIHGYIGADILEKKYNFTKEMSDAVRYHTTLRKDMTMLDKIIYLADKTEEGRSYPNIEEERKLAKEDIDKAIILTLENSIEHTKKKGKTVNKLSEDALKVLSKKKSF